MNVSTGIREGARLQVGDARSEGVMRLVRCRFQINRRGLNRCLCPNCTRKKGQLSVVSAIFRQGTAEMSTESTAGDYSARDTRRSAIDFAVFLAPRCALLGCFSFATAPEGSRTYTNRIQRNEIRYSVPLSS